jgi:5-oxopent-3-ene-1,2,5-tricarboxylate decarboxylase / 2-hydroxyhepta-2,4-diene-1,7-dioate isomerase
MTPSGRVYGAALNFKGTFDALRDAFYREPYKQPPLAPVLYIKSANTWAGSGDPIPLPPGVDSLRMGGTLGVVIGRTATRVSERDALDYVAGYTVANDVEIPHTSYFRPPIREKCRDGFLPLGPFVGAGALDPDAAAIRVFVNGTLAASNSTKNLVRPVAKLIADITEFMSLQKGDVLLVGEPENSPLVSAGGVVRVEIEGVGELENPWGAASQAAAGSQPALGAVNVNSPGRPGTPPQAGGLPPIDYSRIGTIFAVGLNYADHARELSFKAPEQPLIFMKTPVTLVGDGGETRRPPDVEYMHYECELAVVIGKEARAVRREDAYQYVGGYAVANDYAIRDYLENYYRPNLRVKNRDSSTPFGPKITQAADPMNLTLRTIVNGKVTQEGNTRDMIFSIPILIEYLSAFMTLSPGDVILTGTPEGLVGVHKGDEVVAEIEGLGRVVNRIV